MGGLPMQAQRIVGVFLPPLRLSGSPECGESGPHWTVIRILRDERLQKFGVVLESFAPVCHKLQLLTLKQRQPTCAHCTFTHTYTYTNTRTHPQQVMKHSAQTRASQHEKLRSAQEPSSQSPPHGDLREVRAATTLLRALAHTRTHPHTRTHKSQCWKCRVQDISRCQTSDNGCTTTWTVCWYRFWSWNKPLACLRAGGLANHTRCKAESLARLGKVQNQYRSRLLCALYGNQATDRASESSPLAPAARGPGELGRRSACMLRGPPPPRRWAGVLRCTSPQKNRRQLCVFWRQHLFLALSSNPLQGLVLLAVRSYEGLLADRLLRSLFTAVVITCLKVADQCFTRRAARIDNA